MSMTIFTLMIADRGNKERKLHLARRKLIRCGLCPYHRSENASKHPRSDKGKNHRRKV